MIVEYKTPSIRKPMGPAPKPHINTDTRTRYSDAELKEFKELILKKLGEAQKDYELFCTLVTMKPLPDCEQYIIPSYANDWDPLPRELQMIALKSAKYQMPNEDEYRNEMTDEQRAGVRKHFRKLMDKKRIALFRILKQMPKTMFLLLRFVHYKKKLKKKFSFIILEILILYEIH